jgi:CPA2 family monovalent cation:H+ antiporter-2
LNVTSAGKAVATLIGLGLATGLVIASVHEKRDEFRRELQQAAGRSVAETTHSVRTKALRSPQDAIRH